LPETLEFIRCNGTTWNHTRRQLQVLTIVVYGKYCCLFALYMDRGHTPKQFVSLFDAWNLDRHVEGMYVTEFEA